MITIEKAQFHISMVFSQLSKKNSYLHNSLGKQHTLNIASKQEILIYQYPLQHPHQGPQWKGRLKFPSCLNDNYIVVKVGIFCCTSFGQLPSSSSDSFFLPFLALNTTVSFTLVQCFRSCREFVGGTWAVIGQKRKLFKT